VKSKSEVAMVVVIVVVCEEGRIATLSSRKKVMNDEISRGVNNVFLCCLCCELVGWLVVVVTIESTYVEL